MATQEIINIGALPNDGTGDPLRVAFDKINNNFSNLFATFVNTQLSYTFGNTEGQVIFEYPANQFTQGQFYIQSMDLGTPDSQTITLNVQLNNIMDDVKFTGYGTTIFGNAISSYNADYEPVSGNIRILVNPLTSDDLTHLVASQIMWTGPNIVGMALLADGYVDEGLATEVEVLITTES